MVEMSCSSLTETGIELELYGQILPDGRLRPGKIAAAQGGTLYIDEVACAIP